MLMYGILHLCFCCELYLLQIKSGRYFLHEHPDGATSWDVKCMQNLLNHPAAIRVRGDMCPHGMQSKDHEGTGHVLKPTGWATNSPFIAEKVSERCSNFYGKQKWHRHVHLVGGKAVACQVYPPHLCTAILKGLRNQLKHDGNFYPNEIGSVCCEEPVVNEHFTYVMSHDINEHFTCVMSRDIK